MEFIKNKFLSTSMKRERERRESVKKVHIQTMVQASQERIAKSVLIYWVNPLKKVWFIIHKCLIYVSVLCAYVRVYTCAYVSELHRSTSILTLLVSTTLGFWWYSVGGWVGGWMGGWLIGCFCDRFWLCSYGWPGTHRGLFASASSRLKSCATTPGLTLFLETESPIDLGFADQARRAGQQASKICLCLPLKWEYKHTTNTFSCESWR